MRLQPFHSQVQKYTLPVRIGCIIIIVWCYISGAGLQGKFEIDHSWEWKSETLECHLGVGQRNGTPLCGIGADISSFRSSTEQGANMHEHRLSNGSTLETSVDSFSRCMPFPCSARSWQPSAHTDSPTTLWATVGAHCSNQTLIMTWFDFQDNGSLFYIRWTEESLPPTELCGPGSVQHAVCHLCTHCYYHSRNGNPPVCVLWTSGRQSSWLAQGTSIWWLWAEEWQPVSTVCICLIRGPSCNTGHFGISGIFQGPPTNDNIRYVSHVPLRNVPSVHGHFALQILGASHLRGTPVDPVLPNHISKWMGLHSNASRSSCYFWIQPHQSSQHHSGSFSLPLQEPSCCGEIHLERCPVFGAVFCPALGRDWGHLSLE